MTLPEQYDRLLDRLTAELQAEYGDRLVTVAVFGSVGRGTPRPGSDVDVLVIARDLPTGRSRRVEGFLPVERRLTDEIRTIESGGIPVAISPVLKTPTEVEQGSPLFLDMVEDARILHDVDRYFAGYLDRLRGRLRELGSRRIWLGGAWYWDLKPDFKPGEVFTWP
jgi:predicted nucleotidyltransferase